MAFAVALAGCAPKPPNDVAAVAPLAQSTASAIAEGAPSVRVVAEDLPAPPPPEPRDRRRGFLGLFKGPQSAPPPELAEPTEPPKPADASPAPADSLPAGAPDAVAEAPAPSDAPASARPRLLGFLSEASAAPAAPPPTMTSFGPLQKACGVSKRAMGQEVARSPGPGTYRLYDTRPNTAAPRVQYVTGFKDRCPRQLFAALVLFGDPLLHETKRYDRSNRRAFTQADLAYERVKGRVCSVGKGSFCPARHQAKLNKQVALLTAYPSFGSTREWLDVVLFKGTLAGQSVEN